MFKRNNRFTLSPLFETIGSLANVIRQLSNLAFHADDIFNGILNESKRLGQKTEQLQHRISQLAENVTGLDFQQEQVAFTDLNCSELFKSSSSYDQEVLSRQTMPIALARKYNMCDKAPPLHLLNPFRDDGKDATKFYTDPNFFFDLWKDQMLKETEKEKFSKKMISNSSLNKQMQQIEESHTSKKSKKPRKPENTTEKMRSMMSQQGEFFVDSKQIPENQQHPSADYSPYGTIEAITTANRDLDASRKAAASQVDGRLNFNDGRPTQHFRLNDPGNASILQTAQVAQKENTNHVRFNQTPEIIPRSPVMIKSDSPVLNSSANAVTQNFAIPPPPPMPGQLIYNNSSSSLNKSTINGSAKMPASGAGMQPTSLAQEIQKKQQELKSAPLNPPKPSTQFDVRSTLLASIREGIQLRSVQQRQQKQVDKQNSAHLKDVASILARRVAMQLSDSESNHSNVESEDDDWVNDN